MLFQREHGGLALILSGHIYFRDELQAVDTLGAVLHSDAPGGGEGTACMRAGGPVSIGSQRKMEVRPWNMNYMPLKT